MSSDRVGGDVMAQNKKHKKIEEEIAGLLIALSALLGLVIFFDALDLYQRYLVDVGLSLHLAFTVGTFGLLVGLWIGFLVGGVSVLLAMMISQKQEQATG